MLRTTLAGLRLYKARLATTVLAIALGVAFVTGTLVFSATLEEAFSAQVMGSADDYAAIARVEAPAGEEAPLLTGDDLEAVRALDETAGAAGITKGAAPLLDGEGRAVGSMPTAALSVGEGTRYAPAEGRLPEGPGEVALSTSSAETTGYGIGDTVTVLDPDGERRRFTVAGLIDFGTDTELAYRGAVAFDQATAERMTGVEGFVEIDATGAEGVPDREVARAVAEAVGGAAEVRTGRATGELMAEAAGAQAEVVGTGLLLFALVSLFVAGIVIYNTFAILFAQRRRETALLRCVGAGRGQVLRGLLLEALAIGLVASALGVAAGIALGRVGFEVGGELFGGVPGSVGPVVGVLPVAAGMAAGVGMTLVAAVAPAVRAMRVPPLAALRDGATAQGLGREAVRWRVAAAAATGLVSAGLLWAAGGQDEPTTAMAVAAAAGMTAFLGVAAVAPLLVRGVVAAVFPLMRRTGVPGMLAADNSRRSPKRAAAAMLALTVGAALISGYAVLNASMQETLTEKLERKFPVDYTVGAPFDDEDAVVPGRVVRALREAPEVEAVFEKRAAATALDGGGTEAVAYYGAELGEDVGVEEEAGDLADVAPGRVAVSAGAAGGAGVGDAVSLDTESGERSYEVAAVLPEDQGMNGVTMVRADFEEAFPGVREPVSVQLRGADGAAGPELRDAVYDAVADDPLLQVMSSAEMKSQFEDAMKTAFLVITAMLGLAVVIAVFGVANTLTLSVLERTRESALLRALGLSRGQLRRMLAAEAVLLCLIGAGVGIGLGVLFGWAAGRAAQPGMLFALPVGQIAGFIAVAAAAGLLASVLPARRAAGASIAGVLAAE
ncbi:ABC transporter permease [Nocardiopsis potens]|uniref:ABC transporter permease n=1 Tax=Nocardiopsis potens TaxID=1246458 RepID=UPI000348740F|nr:FtsX family ABC transporter permease [Nocardiopsis potens]